ncbi:TetR/AcrR family transcriptional regulator [Acidomonas methanolica]|uniref:Transcriptional regulator n=1 Tax=Acidomonas methanolica NBRC 104435 TaxID=1231351 RepID=A0A023D864_ACIMT|nr:TetR/AcrR family transcriptional regulator [Acidomonas methanolica]MBU2655730.1 TetR/AcrR family transcriptional regulator [Acidomonas methanolica]TCS19688.1 TetR family transcriptional regulator [Acidomonas methanolica]GAJ30357.1 transcriptional regulator [Acidomonas methanolica NBRC 104435]GBQ49725.1 transcriptional regulator [Acidomonas methanolica]GEL00662.1 TetR family transcriptional regulator [Acidomonas methanolica NBRC 104435]
MSDNGTHVVSKKAINRDYINEVACRLFARQGFARTSMRDIASAIGIRAPSLYNHIGSKEEVLNRIILAMFYAQYSDLIRALTGTENPVEQVRKGIVAQIQFRIAHANAVVVAARETLELDADIKTEVLNLRNRQYQAWADVVERGVRAGVFHVPSVRLASITMYDFFNYLEINILYIQENIPDQELCNWYVELALQSLGSHF